MCSRIDMQTHAGRSSSFSFRARTNRQTRLNARLNAGGYTAGVVIYYGRWQDSKGINRVEFTKKPYRRTAHVAMMCHQVAN